jgi:two-component system cell cycle sensor histidine kinase/response regulator CckA
MGIPLRVLVVEDSEDDTILVLRVLRQGGYDPVFERVDTAEAMNAALDQHEWDVVLSDYALPGFSMPAALGIVKEKELDIPFIVVSGAIGEESAVELMRAGAHDYVMKDRLARLAPAVERELREAEMRRERRRIEAALRQSEYNYRVLFESMIDGMAVIDIDKMTIALANENGARTYGFGSPQEMAGVCLFDYVHPDDCGRVVPIIVDDMVRVRPRTIHEFRTFTRDGREIWLSAVAAKIEYQGKAAGLLSFRDVTDKKKAEEERKKMEQQLQFAGRLAAVGELAAGVAHELNNPLAAVLLYSQLLKSRNDLDESLAGDIEIVHREAERATRITGSLLSFARRHKPEKSPVSLNEVIMKSAELNAYQMKLKNIEVEMDLDSDLPVTMADFHQLQQVFVNIINNAEQAMSDDHEQHALRITSRQSGDMIRITFADDGPGISEENIKRVFDPFFTTKEVGKGTGLGLSICYGIVEEHGGRISVESTPGQGATFTVEIPVDSGSRVLIEQSR